MEERRELCGGTGILEKRSSVVLRMNQRRISGVCCLLLSQPLLLLLLLQAAKSTADALLHSSRSRRAEDGSSDSWYTRYPAYPTYCATPEEMASRKIPPLQDDKRLGETRLHHVTAVLRHGARTPWKAGLNCWEDYNTNPETAVWDCNLTAYLSPPPPAQVSEEEGNTKSHDEAMFLFEKRYDALTDPDRNLSNFLHGTCQLGQLLLQGYEQEFVNGQFLRDAYVYDASAYNHDARMRLLDVSGGKGKPAVWEDVYYRVDDEIRTLLSGQVVLRGLFGPEMDAYFQSNKRYPVIPLHTADYVRDIVDPNENVCPRLAEIRERNQASPGFQALNQSAEAVLLRRFQREVLKVPDPNNDMDAVDCLMTTMCTDRPLPDAINDYHPSEDRELHHQQNSTEWSEEYGTDLFQRLYEFDIEQYVYTIKAGDAEYAKLAMRPLWYEIMSKINPHIQGATGNLNKLALFSGHDSTIMPLLASLGVWNDTSWAPYASMVVIELHELNIDGTTQKDIYPTDFAFRLIYNGVAITPQIPGCPVDLELCDINVLIDNVLLVGDCERKHELAVQYKDAVTRTREILSTTEGVIYFLLLVSVSAAAGGIAVFVYVTGSLPRKRYQQAVNDDDDDGISLNGTNGNGYRDEARAERIEMNLT